MEWCLPLFEMPLGLIQLPVYCQSHDEVTDFFSRTVMLLFRTIIHEDELLRKMIFPVQITSKNLVCFFPEKNQTSHP